jgi:WD40 repeat protein
MALDPSGRFLAVSSAEGELRLFDVASGEKRFESRSPRRSVDVLEVAPDGRAIVATGNGELRVFDIARGAVQVLPGAGPAAQHARGADR